MSALREEKGGKVSIMRIISIIMVCGPMLILFFQAATRQPLQWFEALSMMVSGGGLKWGQKHLEEKMKNNQ